MFKKKSYLMLGAFVLLSALIPVQIAQGQTVSGSTLTPIEELGKNLFFDKNLSKNSNQSCASCHDPSVGYTGPNSQVNAGGAVYAGSVISLYGNRKPPTAAYAGDSGLLVNDGNGWSGGMFWDGRATGENLGDPLAEQAQGPFLNPLEHALTDPYDLRDKVKAGIYVNLYERVWGVGSLDGDINVVYDQIGRAIAAYERSPEVNPYTSKFDKFWDNAQKKGRDVAKINVSNWANYRNSGLNDTELYGLAIFNDTSRANCASCHSLKPGSRGYPLFTDYSYDNLGVPKNPANPFYNNIAYNPDGGNWVDYGLGGYLETVNPQMAPAEIGKMKVPTLRNVDKRPNSTFIKAYGHNGYFKSLADVINFYHWRGMGGGMDGGGGMGGGGRMGGGGMGSGGMGGGGMGGMMFPAPEVNENLASLNSFPGRDQSYILAFLKTLSDGYFQR